MGIIQIAFWHGTPLANIKYKHLQEIPYSRFRLTAIIDHILSHNCAAMVRKTETGVVVFIDNGRFQQK